MNNLIPHQRGPGLPAPAPLRSLPTLGLFSWVTSHRLAAGFPSPAQGYEEETLDSNEYLSPHPVSTFVFTVSGDSMIGVGIYEGDKVVVDRALADRAVNGDIVVAVVDSEYTLKRLVKKRGQAPELHAGNPAYKPRFFSEGEQLDIRGVVVGVVRRFRS